MNEKKRSRRDFIQNITIALLSVTMVLLFTRTQAFILGTESEFFTSLSASAPQADSSSAGHGTALSAPVHVAVTGPYGRYGNITLTTTDEDFAILGRLMRDAFDSAGPFSICDKTEFLSALKNTSVYYDFLSALPVSVLSEMSGLSKEIDESARRLVIGKVGDEVILYLWGDGDRCLRASTAISPADLESAADSYELGNAVFALDIIEEYPQAQNLSPCSLFLEETPTFPVLTSEVPSFSISQLLSTLQFNPNTNSRYTESSGTEVVMDAGRSVRIRADGSINYQSSDASTLSVEAVNEQPSLQEAVEGVSTLLNTLLSSTASEAVPFLESISQANDTTTLVFGYQINGVPVAFSNGKPAASVTLTGTSVSSLTLQFRQYTSTASNTVLLPLRQALAIASRQQGSELSIGYVDDGSPQAYATWLAE